MSLNHRPHSAIHLRLRTAFFIACAFSFLLTAYFTVSYFTIKHSLITRSDHEVNIQLDNILAEIHSPADLQNFSTIAERHDHTGEAAISLYAVRLDSPAIPLDIIGSIPVRKIFDSGHYPVNELPATISEGNSIRLLSKQNSIVRINAAINLISFEEVFDSMLQTYLLLLILGILVSLGVAVITADLALAPLKILIRSAREIKEEHESGVTMLPTNTRTVEINELASLINDTLSERNRNINVLRNFTADAAHELRTPLTILKGEMEVDLRTKGLSANERHMLQSNLEEVHRLIRIVEDLLILARIEQHEYSEIKKNYVSWDVCDLVTELTKILEPIIEEKSLRIILRFAFHPRSMLPREQVERIIYNILLNSLQYSKKDGNVTITVDTQSNDEMVIGIRDNGIGIAQPDIHHIFDRFWRADRSHTRTQGGSGLGLAIAKQYADRLGIGLECVSELGTGTLMKCILPASD